jgi:hypothetical protein
MAMVVDEPVTTKSSQTVSDLVNKRVAEAIKRMALNKKGTQTIVSPTHEVYYALCTHSTSRKRQIGALPEEEEKRRSVRQKITEEGFCDAQGKRETASAWRQREAEEIVSASKFRWSSPDSYPDEITLLPAPLAISYILREVPIDVLEAARYRAHVHTGPGVFIPSFLQIHLSTGLKHMFYSPPKPNLIREAWEDFENRMRWRWFYAQKILTDDSFEDREYDPDYEIPHDSNICDYRIAYIEEGLDVGRTYVSEFVRTVGPHVKVNKEFSNLVDSNRLQSYLMENHLIVVPSDKNLGCCVIKRTWFIDQCNAFLANPLNYQQLDSEQVERILLKTYQAVEDTAQFVDEHLKFPQLANFIRSKIQGKQPNQVTIPVFYGIPKIHKNPVKIRPIVPCHSAIQNPAAKYVSKQLKPLINEQPWVIRGSKDFAIKVSNFTRPQNKKIFLCGGDIVAFYPSIPTDDAINITLSWWKIINSNTSTHEKHMFARCLRLALRDCMCQFQGRVYIQSRGLAMGMACSPDVANVFGCHYENEFIPKEERILFFGRFIDDVFMIVEADSEEEALSICQDTVAYGDLEMTWSVSASNMQFLDLFVYIDPSDGSIQHKPFRKQRNHLERIPWISSHPKDVKRGTFIGEMSRLATLCSNHESYREALNDLMLIYVSRGYPVDMVRTWLRTNAEKRWNSRLSESREERNVFVLKSVFNPAWESFNVHELGNRVSQAWSNSLAHVHHARDQHRSRSSKSSVFPFERGYDLVEVTTSGLSLAGELADAPLTVVVEPSRKDSRTVYIRPTLDLSKTGDTRKDWIVSRRRTKNLFDVLATLRKVVLDAPRIEDDPLFLNMDVWYTSDTTSMLDY